MQTSNNPDQGPVDLPRIATVPDQDAPPISPAGLVATETPELEAVPAPRRALVAWFSRYALLLVLIALVIVYSALLPDTFPTLANLRDITATQSVLIIMALGLTFPLVSGEFDFSFGPVVAFAATLTAVLTVNDHWSLLPAALAVVLACLAIGLVNSFFIVYVGISSLITTLGMGTLIIGLTLAVSGSSVIAGPPGFLTAATNNSLFGLPYPVYYSLALAAVVWFVYSHTAFGRYLYFTGEGRKAAKLSGLPVDRLRTYAFVILALMCAIAGIVNFGRLGSADPNLGTSFLLPGTAAVFLGATAIVPGRFNAWGTVLAVYLLVTGVTGLQLLGGAGYLEDVFNGGALVLAVTFAHLVRRGRSVE